MSLQVVEKIAWTKTKQGVYDPEGPLSHPGVSFSPTAIGLIHGVVDTIVGHHTP